VPGLADAWLTRDVRESYAAWRNASSAVQRAYERWATWGPSEREVGFGGYLAALQQEEHAAKVYRLELERARGRRTPEIPLRVI
jgi:hypothetical protein